MDDKNTREKDVIKRLNEYLEKSIYTHGMNVSGNIITNEDELIYTKRGGETWDKATLYCSTNGVCEINNSKVYHYNHSVQCDRPLIGEYNTETGDFGGELSREAMAELGVDINKSKWKYYGFSIMGYCHKSENANKDENKSGDINSNRYHSFPAHINILAYTEIDYNIEEIRKRGVKQLKSTRMIM